MIKLPILSGIAIFGLIACTSMPAAQPSSSDGPGPTERVVETVPKPDIEEDIVTTSSETEVTNGKYKRITYGQEKELVCTTPVLAKGKLKNRPNLQIMWENYLYPRPDGIWSEIGGMVEVNGNLPLDQGRWTNACAVRLSYMLNKAGHKIPRDENNKTVSGGNKDQYFYRLANFEEYLIDTYGEPDIDISDGTANSFDLPITPGIVLMDFPDNSFTGHVTIWNGAGTVDGAEIGGYRVLFWDLPCFIPKDRQSKGGASKAITSP